MGDKAKLTQDPRGVATELDVYLFWVWFCCIKR